MFSIVAFQRVIWNFSKSENISKAVRLEREDIDLQEGCFETGIIRSSDNELYLWYSTCTAGIHTSKSTARMNGANLHGLRRLSRHGSGNQYRYQERKHFHFKFP